MRATGGVAEVRRGAELLALTGLALVQPVLDVLGRSPETFVFRGVEGAQLVLFALAVALAPALGLWLIGRASGLLGPGVRRGVHLVMVGGLAATAALVGLRMAGLAKGGAALALALVVGAGFAALYVRIAGARLFLLYLAPLPLLAAGLFLFSSSVSGLVTGGAAEVAEGVESTRPVVMMVLDELPTATLLDAHGGIDAEEFPNFARLAEASTWFRNYTAHNASTVQAVPSLLSGRLPERGKTPLYTDWPENLFTLLGGSYQMAVQETVTELCPPSVCEDGPRTVTRRRPIPRAGLSGVVGDAVEVTRQLVSLDAEPEVAVDAFTEEVIEVPAPAELGAEGNEVTNQPTRFRDFLAGLVDSTEPTLHFVHLILPHGPWRFYPDGTEYESPNLDPEGEIGGVWTHEWPAELTRFRLELQTQYADALVGQTLDRLRESGLWDEALFVLVADHGGAFVVGEPGRALAEANVPDVMWTPMFIRSPGLAHGVDDANVEASDLLPTMSDLLGIDHPYESDGGSAIGRADGPSVKRYRRLQNAFQTEPDALLRIDAAVNYERLLTEDWPVVDGEDPVGGFYRRYPLGDLLGRPVGELDRAAPAGSADLTQLGRLRSGGDGPLPAYLGGTVDIGGDADGRWVVVAVDGVVAGFSDLFPTIGSDTSFALLLDEDRLSPEGDDIELFVTDDDGATLRPLRLPE